MNAIIAKVKKAQARNAPPVPADPLEGLREPRKPLEATKAGANGLTRTRTRGRPRKCIPLTLIESWKPFQEWAETRVVRLEGNVVYVGSPQQQRRRLDANRTIIIETKYPRRTLVEDIREYCSLRGLQVRLPRTLRGWLITFCHQRGWDDVRAIRTPDCRQAAICGINLVGLEPWDGNDRFAPGHVDRQRWKRKASK